MKLNAKHHAILKTLAIASKANKELRGIEIIDQTQVPFFFWQRNIGFSDVFPLLRDLENAGLITSRSDIDNPEPLTGACPSYYRIANHD